MKEKILQKIKDDEIIFILRKILKDCKNVYLVGGAIRDYALGSVPKEYDFVTEKAQEVALYVAKKLKVKSFGLGKNSEQIHRISLGEGGLDFSSIKNETIETNLKKRDFTVDSIGVVLHTFEICDPSQGIKDIEKRILKMTYKDSFSDDPLRILKGFRLISYYPQLKWEIKTKEKVKELAPLIEKIPKERIKTELSKILLSKNCTNTLKSMFKENVLELIFPFVKGLNNVIQTFPHKSDVLSHTFEILELLDENISFSQNLIFVNFSQKDLIKLRLAILFHDSGKKECVLEEQNRIHFYGHEKISAKIAKENLLKLRYSKEMAYAVSHLCQLHLRPLFLFNDKNASTYSKRRLIRKAGDDFPLLVMLSFLDFSSKHKTDKEIADYYLFCEQLYSLYEKERDTILSPPKLIDGISAMKIVGLEKAGPELGKIMKSLRQEQVDGKIKTKEEAIKFLKKYKNKIVKE